MVDGHFGLVRGFIDSTLQGCRCPDIDGRSWFGFCGRFWGLVKGIFDNLNFAGHHPLESFLGTQGLKGDQVLRFPFSIPLVPN
jgi:hypothetical protein